MCACLSASVCACVSSWACAPVCLFKAQERGPRDGTLPSPSEPKWVEKVECSLRLNPALHYTLSSQAETLWISCLSAFALLGAEMPIGRNCWRFLNSFTHRTAAPESQLHWLQSGRGHCTQLAVFRLGLQIAFCFFPMISHDFRYWILAQ